MSLDLYSDNEENIVSERIYTHLSDEDKRIRFNKLTISMETGVGGVSENLDPQISMQLSKDGGKTYGNWYNTPVGKIGEYMTKVQYRRLGVAEKMTFKLRMSGKVKKVLIGSYLE